ncbi:MAG: hypothetical protein LBL04_15030 [Bacteroidales bacterium]|jgi:YD repeat-containing protein|nr:hypothetical protein [Bacteroidales bacterium]
MKKYTTILLFLLFGNITLTGQIYYRQDGNSRISYTMPVVAPASPNTATMIKFIENPVDIKHGIASVNIPIYEIRAGDYVLPISMSYHGGGIKIEDEGGSLGLGWALQAEPSVSRAIRGLPDEFYGGTVKGFRYNMYKDFDYNTKNLSLDIWKELASGNYDQSPDVYYYSLPCRSGRFVLKDAYNSVLIPHEPVKVDYSSTSIKITDDDGTDYEFGGSTNCLEKTKGTIGSINYEAFTRWYARKINLNKGLDQILFQYDDYNTRYPYTRNYAAGFSIDVSRDDLYRPILTVKDTRYRPYPVYRLLPPNYDTPEDRYGQMPGFNSSHTFQAIESRLVKTIIFPDGKVCFSYSYGKKDLIKKIDVLDNMNNLIRSVEFFVNDYGNDRYLLDSCRVVDFRGTVSERYRFEYWDSNRSFPNVQSNAIDHWGYYNGVSGNQNLIPTVEFTIPGTDKKITFPGANRQANYYAQTYSLKKINWPGGRSTVFDYENNSTRAGYWYNPVNVGGIRISSIREDLHGRRILRYFSYQSEPFSDSEGDVEYYGRPKVNLSIDDYCLKTSLYKYDNGSINHNKTVDTYTYMERPIPDLNLNGGTGITYQKVREIREDSWNSTSLCKEYEFSTYQVFKRSDLSIPFDTDALDDWKYGGLLRGEKEYYKDNSTEDSSLISRKTYDHATYKVDYVNNGIRWKMYYLKGSIYDPGNPDFSIPSNSTDKPLVAGVYSQAYGGGCVRVTEENTWYYPLSEGSVKTRKTCSYNSGTRHMNPVVITTVDSKGMSITEEFTYPEDYTGTVNLGQSWLIGNNCLKTLLQYWSPGILARAEYLASGAPMKPSAIYTYTGSSGGYEPRLYYEYYASGKIKSAYQPGGAKTVYLWGYNNQYPIAKIENADWNRVVQAAGGSAVIDAIASKSRPEDGDWTVINGLRRALPDAMVTTYAYQPLIGLISEISPSGQAVSYGYDPSGRLAGKRDEQGNILEVIQYHLKK